jgi:ubiquitin C-terminal hydrolase
MFGVKFRNTYLNIPNWKSEILSQYFQLLVSFGLLHQLSVAVISDTQLKGGVCHRPLCMTSFAVVCIKGCYDPGHFYALVNDP